MAVMPWFYSAGSEQKGPVEDAEFESLIASGVIRPETLVWQPGMPNWQSASAVRGDLLPPALPPSLDTPPAYLPAPAVSDGRRYGGFWIRFLARIIDGLVLIIPQLAVIVLVAGTGFITAIMNGDFAALTEGGGVFTAATLINAVLYAAYEAYLTSNYGGTLGKLALGLRVCLLDGSPLNLQQALIRHLLYAGGGILGALIPAIAFLNGLWVIVDTVSAAFDPQKRALHDRIAKTLVVKK